MVRRGRKIVVLFCESMFPHLVSPHLAAPDPGSCPLVGWALTRSILFHGSIQGSAAQIISHLASHLFDLIWSCLCSTFEFFCIYLCSLVRWMSMTRWLSLIFWISAINESVQMCVGWRGFVFLDAICAFVYIPLILRHHFVRFQRWKKLWWESGNGARMCFHLSPGTGGTVVPRPPTPSGKSARSFCISAAFDFCSKIWLSMIRHTLTLF